MIARIWRGATPASKADAYFEYLQRTGLADYRSTPGNRGVLVLRRVRNRTAEFTVISLWDSVDAIRAFAGPDIERARYYPEDEDFLIELEPRVSHFEVLAAPGGDRADARRDPGHNP